MSSRRIERLSEVIRQEVSKIVLYELKDPRIGFITITTVELTPDLRHAKVYVSIMGGDTIQKRTFQGLEHARGFIQSEVGKRLQIKFTPHLTFCLDESIKKSLHIAKLIDDAVRGVEKPHEETLPETEEENDENHS
ncbi:MAG: 30S ribosome-binding factor RbfA [Candidatus Brocadiaceae bacterium]